MPNIAHALRGEIVRISRREVRKHTAVLQRVSVSYRHDIAALKREITRLDRELKQLRRSEKPTAPVINADANSLRFVAKGFRSLRHRLGLSASQMGNLLGVSEQSIYNWETKVATPRRAHLPAIAHLRTLGKRDALALLNRQSRT